MKAPAPVTARGTRGIRPLPPSRKDCADFAEKCVATTSEPEKEKGR